MRILAADIGGTHSRFAAADIESLSNITMGDPFIFPTWLEGNESLNDMLEHFQQKAPSDIADLDQYQAVALGVAGAVDGGKATLPNIPWDIDLDSVSRMNRIFLLNDFYAQAHAFMNVNLLGCLHPVRPGPGFGPGSIAIVGAGTGLGHAALKTIPGGQMVIGSESGHGTFSFHGSEERDIEDFFMDRSGNKWISNDEVVSGSGAALLHECLTGKSVSPAQALAEAGENLSTRNFFSRFYARACRNYCLAVHPVERLLISGGIAARNPHLLDCAEFSNEFNDTGHYRHLLERIPIYLNIDQGVGLMGAAIYAWLQSSHLTASPESRS